MPQSNVVNLKVQSLSGFDKSHYHDLTTNVGSLTPVMLDELIPHSIANLNVAASVQLPPLASDAFAKIDLKLEAFAIPLRLLYGGFEKWFADTLSFSPTSDGSYIEFSSSIPYFSVSTGWDSIPQVFDKGSLCDYLGCKLNPLDGYQGARVSLLPFLAYAKIYDDWYRAPLVQRQLFGDGIQASQYQGYTVASLPYLADDTWPFVYANDDDNYWMSFLDNSTIFNLRQRNYGFDYFTNAWPTLQFGDPMSVQPDASGVITIAAIRAANSLQMFEERNNYAPRYYQAIKARYGCDVSQQAVQRSVYLGSATIPIKTYGVDVNASNGQDSRNPFAYSAGAQLGRARGEGFVNLIDNYKCSEPSYIMVIASVVPRAVYSSGVSRVFDRYIRDGGLAEMANPTLQNTGNQPIYGWELTGNFDANRRPLTFGYTDRFADFMTLPDRISGQLREGGDLEAFVLKRDFEEQRGPRISSDFLQIKPTALDEISATSVVISHYGAWMQFGFDYKVVQPLAVSSMPSLQDPAYEHGQTVTVNRGGFRL